MGVDLPDYLVPSCIHHGQRRIDANCVFLVRAASIGANVVLVRAASFRCELRPA